MAGITNIFHKDILPRDVTPEYEMTDSVGVNPGADILLYRRGIIPACVTVSSRGKFSIPLVPLMAPCVNHNANAELRKEVKKFIIESVPHLFAEELSIADGLAKAEKFFLKRGTYMYHVLHSADLGNRIDPFLNFIPEYRCIEICKKGRMIIVLPEPICTGLLSIREPDISYDPLVIPKTRFGMMFAMEYAFMFTVP